MKIISWNIRGSNGIQKTRLIKKRIKMDKPFMLMLQETKCSGQTLKERMSRIWHGCKVLAVDATGAAGGFAIIWHPAKVTLENFISTHFSLSANFTLVDSGVQGVITNVYGPANPRDKNSFLNSLEFLASWVDKQHWVLGGDFNLITNLQEKKGGTRKLDAHSTRFGSIIQTLKLIDVRMDNGIFTWNNKRLGNQAVASKLDRFLLSESIVTSGGLYNALMIPSAGSDHWPISLNWQGLGNQMGKPFRFEHCWFEDPNFKSKVKEWWAESTSQRGNCMYRFQQRLKSLKNKLKIWNREEFGNIFEDKSRLESQLQKVTEEVFKSGYNEQLLKEETILQERLQAREKQEEIYWKQKSRNRWLKEGERNTKFFHRSTIHRRIHNRIQQLKLPNGDPTDSREEIESLLVDHFSDLLQETSQDRTRAIATIAACIPNKVSTAQNDLLNKPVDISELEEAIKQMQRGTAPGPDGFTVDFFVHFWDLFKQDILQIVETSRTSGSILKAFNSTFLTLIPKEEGADSPSLFRPISLCNVIYKITSKIIANRIKPLLPDLISEEQSGFVAGRQILDGILLVNEVAHSLRTTRKPGMLIKLDLAKAFDKINWDFIKAILAAFGFGDNLINWIMGLISTSFFSILINGSPSKCFTPSRGIRQGDPLSPFIFVLAAEGLGRLIKLRIQEKRLKGLTLHRGSETQSHQQFVDDTMLMAHPAVQEAKELKRTLKLFAEASGMEANPRKSSTYFFNTPPITQRNITRILGFQVGSLPTKYLGIPLSDSTIKQASWQDLLDKLQSKLADWSLRPLNFPSRLTLVKAVLQSMPAYLFSILAAPKSVLKQIKAIQRSFLWGGSQNSSKWSLVDWNSVCTPKKDGGLGLRDPHTSNKVFNAKIWWRWITHDREPWAKLWNAKYAPLWEKQELGRFEDNIPGSGIWNSVSSNRKLVTSHCFWEIRNGEQANFWKDAWQQLPKPQDSFRDIAERMGIHNQNLSKVKDYWQDTTPAQEFRTWLPRGWWQQQIQDIDLQDLEQELQKRKIRVHPGPDKLRWGYKMEGTFSIQEAFQLARGPPAANPDPFWNNLWEAKHWPKITLFLWLVARGRALTWDNLQKRGFTGPSQCVLCCLHSEDLPHLLDNCTIASELWDQGAMLFRQTDRQRGNPQETLRNWRQAPFTNQILNRLWTLFPGFVMWTVWKERNARIFRDRQNSPDTLWDSLVRNLKESLLISAWSTQDFQASASELKILQNWGINLKKLQSTHQRDATIHSSSPDRWQPPLAGSYKLNFDGAAKGNPGQAGFGGAIRNSQGEILWAYWGSIGWDTNNVAELEGLLAGLALVEKLNIKPVTLEGDSQIIINMAKQLQQGYHLNKLTKNWRLECRVERLAEILNRFRHCDFSHVRRRANRVADKLANQGVMVEVSSESTKWPPQQDTEWGRQVTQLATEDKQEHEARASPNEATTGGRPPPPSVHCLQ